MSNKINCPFCRAEIIYDDILNYCSENYEECQICNENKIDLIFSECKHKCCSFCVDNIKKMSATPKIKVIKNESYHHYLFRDH